MRDYNFLPWLNVILGIWLIVSPFLLGYSTLMNVMYNDIIVGVLVAVIAFLSWYTSTRTTTSHR